MDALPYLTESCFIRNFINQAYTISIFIDSAYRLYKEPLSLKILPVVVKDLSKDSRVPIEEVFIEYRVVIS